MTPEDLELIGAGLAVLDPAGVAADVHATLCKLERPDLSFPDEVGPQHLGVVAELWALAPMAVQGTGDGIDRFVERAHRLGARLATHGATAAHYRIVGEALLGVLASTDPGWDRTHDTAWRRLCALISATMQETAPDRPRP